MAGPALAHDLPRGKGFFFLTVSQIPDTPDLLAISGCGTITKELIVGGGSFAHFQTVGSPPFPIVASGHWTAKELVSFDPIGQFGVLIAGTAEWEAVLTSVTPSKAVAPATMLMACNLAPANLFTGLPEGVVVTVGDASFSQILNGLTVFSRKTAFPAT
jgi:hypothetical protein